MTSRHEMLAALCLMGDGEKGSTLFAFASLKDQEGLEKFAHQLCRQGEVDQKELLDHIRKRTRLNRFAPLEEIHPGWIMGKLEGETPRLFGLLCRFLPGDKVRYLISHLPEEAKKRLPSMHEAYRVDPEVAEVVRRLIEKKMTPFVPTCLGKTFSFSDIVWMKSEDLRILFWDLGLEEIRKAFDHVELVVLRAFLARFSPKEAREIRDRLERGDAVSAEGKKEAQAHLVSLPLSQDPFSAGELLREIGYSVFARSLLADELPWASLVCQKLAPPEGYRLKRILGETVGRERNSAPDRREAILGRLFSLAEKGFIRRYWKDTHEVELTQKETAA